MKIKLTDVRGNPFEVEASEIKGQVGAYTGYSKYSLASGKIIMAKESVAEVTALKAAAMSKPELVEDFDNDEVKD